MSDKPISAEEIKTKIIEALKACYDPEIPVNIYDLGLIYDIDIDADANVQVKMTLTSPACPVAETLPPEVQMRIQELAEVNQAQVEVVWDPPWNKEMMTEAAKLELNLM